MAKRGSVKHEMQEEANGLFHDACIIIEQAQKSAYLSVNETLIKRNWLLGMRIQQEVLKERRAEYGEQTVKSLSKALSVRYGKGFTKTNLYNYIGFYQSWPDFFHVASGKSVENEIDNIFHSLRGKSGNVVNIPYKTDVLQSLTANSPIRLSWTHYRIILQELTADGRVWYENESSNEMWSTRTLQRNVSSQYYHRLLKSQ
ncbi:MAG: hypothetical protein K2O69_03450, partial [Odoribacter sp.]|nr:hypothetical protein [Odoribacter sp.]